MTARQITEFSYLRAYALNNDYQIYFCSSGEKSGGNTEKKLYLTSEVWENIPTGSNRF